MQQLGYKFDLDEVKRVVEDAELEKGSDGNVILTTEPSSLCSNSCSVSNKNT
jgi:hypothetical protein